MWTQSQASHAAKPPKRRRPVSQIARLLPIVAICPRSRYVNAPRGLPRDDIQDDDREKDEQVQKLGRDALHGVYGLRGVAGSSPLAIAPRISVSA